MARPIDSRCRTRFVCAPLPLETNQNDVGCGFEFERFFVARRSASSQCLEISRLAHGHRHARSWHARPQMGNPNGGSRVPRCGHHGGDGREQIHAH